MVTIGSNDGVPPKIAEGEVFGRTLRRFRQERGLTQERLAASADLTLNFINSLENGYKLPGLTTILKLAHALGVTPADLLSEFTPAIVKRLVT